MPNTYIRNFIPLGNGQAWASIVDMLVGAGWTYQASGTGTNGIFSPAPTTVTISSASPGIVSWTSHGLRPNVPVVFTTTGTLPAEITPGQTYYIAATTSFTANQFAVSATPAGTPINTSSASTGTTTATVKKVFTNTPPFGNVISSSNQGAALVRISNSAVAAVVYWPSHGLLIGDAVRFDANAPGSLPSGVSNGTTYFIIATGFTADTFQFSATVGGSAVTSSSAGGGFIVASCPTSWGNPNAWARLQDPSGTREFLFQHDNNTSLASNACGAKIRYSASAKFTGTSNGAVSATVPPTATDERYLRGTNSSYGLNMFPQGVTTGGTIFQGAAMSSSPYGWWMAAVTKGGTNRYTALMFDPVVSVAEDPDPYVIHIGGGSTAFEGFAMHTGGGGLGRDGSSSSLWTQTVGGTQAGSWAYMDVTKTLFLYVQPLGYTCTGPVTSGTATMAVVSGTTGSAFMGGVNQLSAFNLGYIGLNTFSGLPDALPVAWARLAVPSSLGSASQTVGAGLKGWSTLCRWTTINRSTFIDTLSNKNWICVGPFWLPWDGVTTPVS